MDDWILEKLDSFMESSEKDMIELQTVLSAIPAIAPESGGEGEYEKRWLSLTG